MRGAAQVPHFPDEFVLTGDSLFFDLDLALYRNVLSRNADPARFFFWGGGARALLARRKQDPGKWVALCWLVPFLKVSSPWIRAWYSSAARARNAGPRPPRRSLGLGRHTAAR
jgi:hypothetical protein